MEFVNAEGFAPVYNGESRLIILGSFPSVKSRAIGFYYGHPQNRFWKTVCAYFGEEIPPDVAGKREFLLRNRVALWDVILSCEIAGSSDASIRKEVVADVPALVRATGAERIFCNGSKSFELLSERFPELLPMTEKLPSTSPANPRFTYAAWKEALDKIFHRG